MRTLLQHANLVLADRVLPDSSLAFTDGTITALGDVERQPGDTVLDCQGRWLMPGIIDLHCDVIEKDVEVRKNVHFPLEFSVREADRRCAACGITTQYHGISFGHGERGLRDDLLASSLARAIRRESEELLVDNRILLRYELASASAVTMIAALIEQGDCDLLSFMDHSPDAGVYKQVVDEWKHFGSAAVHPALTRILHLMDLAEEHGIVMGSHDDEDADRIDFLAHHGVVVTEFPKNMETARLARDRGLFALVGGPNAVRGGSHLKWMSARDAVRAGVAGALCSDYHPTILPQAVFRLWKEGAATLHEAAALVTSRPARALGLEDRGVLEAGRRADLVEFSIDSAGWARVARCWSRGRLVSAFLPPDGPSMSAHSPNDNHFITLNNA